jgi:hypothetical protein
VTEPCAICGTDLDEGAELPLCTDCIAGFITLGVIRNEVLLTTGEDLAGLDGWIPPADADFVRQLLEEGR